MIIWLTFHAHTRGNNNHISLCQLRCCVPVVTGLARCKNNPVDNATCGLVSYWCKKARKSGQQFVAFTSVSERLPAFARENLADRDIPKCASWKCCHCHFVLRTCFCMSRSRNRLCEHISCLRDFTPTSSLEHKFAEQRWMSGALFMVLSPYWRQMSDIVCGTFLLTARTDTTIFATWNIHNYCNTKAFASLYGVQSLVMQGRKRTFRQYSASNIGRHHSAHMCTPSCHRLLNLYVWLQQLFSVYMYIHFWLAFVSLVTA